MIEARRHDLPHNCFTVVASFLPDLESMYFCPDGGFIIILGVIVMVSMVDKAIQLFPFCSAILTKFLSIWPAHWLLTPPPPCEWLESVANLPFSLFSIVTGTEQWDCWTVDKSIDASELLETNETEGIKIWTVDSIWCTSSEYQIISVCVENLVGHSSDTFLIKRYWSCALLSLSINVHLHLFCCKTREVFTTK